MQTLDGKLVSERRLNELKQKISVDFTVHKRRPGLAVIRVGDDPASKIYVAKKIKACADTGIESFEFTLPADTPEATLLARIDDLNRAPNVHGILVQLPLPKHISEAKVLDLVSPEKDVDGFHTVNLGRLAARQPSFVPCTPLGVMSLLEEYKIPIEGTRAVVVGRSRIVGRPMSLLLDHANATVTVVHPATTNPRELTSRADILVVAVGKPGLIQADDVKSGAVVVDVGINRLPNGKIVGDVDFEAVSQKVSFITPVPGGVGPMTIVSLLENTYRAFRHS